MKTDQIEQSENPAGNHVCPWQHVYLLDNFVRPLLHSPRKMFSPHVKPGMKALDIGCGRGFASLGLARLVGETGLVVSVDLQPEMLRMVAKRAEKAGLSQQIRPHQCEVNSIGLSEEFDFVLAFWMAHETPDPSGFLREVFTLLKPSGRFFLIEPKMHVSSSIFEEFVAEAQEYGYIRVENPSVRLSRAVVLAKPTSNAN
ncbi:MAG: class I SAM-dependent methyltransferase [Chloroflexi bacterium]|nr:class I SAM-dependent methyltransferase [Chloroflexota bacterium]